jgi:5-methyltetrahydropteroyltriglutamate--homocysteine methyltransferase
MKRSTDRILTTHVGSLARPKDLLEMMSAKLAGEPYDKEAYVNRIRSAVQESVKQQVASGIDVVSDGEQGKDSFFAYMRDRVTGFDARKQVMGASSSRSWSTEVETFREYYEVYYFGHRQKSRVGPDLTLVCTGPVTYTGLAEVQTDIENLKAALKDSPAVEAFMPAYAPRGLGGNEYYKTEEEYVMAVAEAMNTEYRAIVDAGLVLQISDPGLTGFYSRDPSQSLEEQRKGAEIYVEALNHSLRGIPPEMVRFHTCYGINEGPRIFDVPLADYIDVMFKIKAGAFSFEAANPRHEHEYHVFEEVKLPDGAVIIPGIISHTTNVVEHPELIAERIVRYANLVGRENVIAGADCGFSSQATFQPDIHPKVVWVKFESLAEGARLASEKLWR